MVNEIAGGSSITMEAKLNSNFLIISNLCHRIVNNNTISYYCFLLLYDIKLNRFPTF
jgi:hypothetical protein